MKFAYLIMTHGNYELLAELIKALDSPENDIFIHFDSKCGQIDENRYVAIARHSKVFFVKDRVSVEWARVQCIEVPFKLLEMALRGNYDYYHLMSGQDFPIKSNRYIQDFFIKNSGKEFVNLSTFYDEDELMYRVGYYHWINGNLVNRYKYIRKFNSLLVRIQMILHLRRIPSTKNFRGGAMWFSVTHNFAEELLSEKEEMLKLYKYTHIPDEIYLQTFVRQHHYEDRLYKDGNEYSCCRLIDFKRGTGKNPYVWQSKDYDELMKSSCLWARKFSENDMAFIRRIGESIR